MKKWKQYLHPIFLIYILSGAVCGFITADLIELFSFRNHGDSDCVAVWMRST